VSDVSDGKHCPETITRTYRATDLCENTAECTQRIINDDTIPPEITAPPDTLVQCFKDVPEPDISAVIASDICCSTPTVAWEGDDYDISEVCPLIITRTYSATDSCENKAWDIQLITVNDTTPPTITCPPAILVCPGRVPEPDISAVTATDNCDSVTVTWEGDVSDGNTCPETIIRTYRATDLCKNTAECTQIITVNDEDPPWITAPPDIQLPECNMPVVFGVPEYGDSCQGDSVPREYLSLVEEEIIKTWDPEICWETQTKCWTVYDFCANSARACQKVAVMLDTVPPQITFDEPVKEIEEGDSLPWDENPTVTDNCFVESQQAGPVTFTADPENYRNIYERCYTAVDSCFNLGEACQTIIELLAPPPYCTFRCWNWVADCLPEPNRHMSTLPACIRDDYFYDLFPGGVTIGIDGPSGYSILLTSPQAVEEFGCSYGISRVLTRDYVNPKRYELKGILAGEIMALRFNREYSCGGYFEGIGYPAMESCYGNYVIPDTTDPSNSVRRFAGLTVDQFLALADQTIGGNPDVLIPYGANIDHLWETAAWLNNRFSDCGGLVESGPSVSDVERRMHSTEENAEEVASKPLPEVFSIGLQPNPLHGSTNIALALPAAGNVSVEIFDVRGRQVRTLVDEARSAGYHDIVWYGRDASGAVVGSGVYFCRVKINGQSVALEKMIKL
jgi:hypothetical protein